MTDLSGYARKSTAPADTRSGLRLRLRIAVPGRAADADPPQHLTCGKFSYSGNNNTAIYTTIAVGITNRSVGGTMGAFGTTMSAEEILAVLTFLRFEERRRIASGEIPDPYAHKDE